MIQIVQSGKVFVQIKGFEFSPLVEMAGSADVSLNAHPFRKGNR